MIARDGDRLIVSAPMRMGAAQALLNEGVGLIGSDQQLTIDLSGVSDLDSSSLAVMLAWTRSAALLRSTLVFSGIPPAIKSLADLYGVRELLPEA
ncbi:MAG: STAS domain-containing protein [Azonexus sp.]|nr:STAS domain-containing protein [Azonexus sp.]